MASTPDFDLKEAHKYFSASCFNEAWNYIEKKDRTPDDDQAMINLCQASIFHWSQREDCTPQNLSVGYWQAARVYALVGQTDNAIRYGQMCLAASENEPPFYQGYAYEALARAEALTGNRKKATEYLSRARACAEDVDDSDSKQILLDDLGTIEV